MPKSLNELIIDKAKLAIASYPTQGITLQDLIDLTIELCNDFERNPSPRTVKSVIKRAGLLKIKGKYYPAVPAQRKPYTETDDAPVQVVEIRHNKTDWRLRVYGGAKGV